MEEIPGYRAGMMGTIELGRGLTESVASVPPEMARADIPYLQETARREALINALSSQALERQLTPETARMREGLRQQLEQDFAGGPSQELSNLWLRQGLSDVIGTGTRTESGFARSALADRSRRDYFANRQALQDRVAAYLAANPSPVAGIDPGSLAGIVSQAAADNLNLRNAYRQQVLGALGSQAANVSGAFNQAMQMEAARSAANLSAYNQAMAQNVAAANVANAQNAAAYNQILASNAGARNAAAAAGSANQAGLMGAGIGAGGAIVGGAIAL